MSDSGALPGPPSLEGHRWLSRRISFKNRDAMTVATEHGRRAQSDHASAADHDLAHPYLLVHYQLDAHANLQRDEPQGFGERKRRNGVLAEVR